MDDAEQEAREHQTDRGFPDRCPVGQHPVRRDRPPPRAPAEIENPVDASEDMIVGDEVPQRSADKEFQLISGPTADHAALHMMPP